MDEHDFNGYKAVYFKRRELACRCCGKLVVSLELVKRLDALRARIRQPIYVNSGYRCEKHNKAVGGANGSYHKKGMAADISCPNISLDLLWKAARQVFPTAVKYGRQGFVHVDIGPARSWATE